MTFSSSLNSSLVSSLSPLHLNKMKKIYKYVVSSNVPSTRSHEVGTLSLVFWFHTFTQWEEKENLGFHAISQKNWVERDISQNHADQWGGLFNKLGGEECVSKSTQATNSNLHMFMFTKTKIHRLFSIIKTFSVLLTQLYCLIPKHRV